MFREAASLILTTGMKHAKFPCDFGVVLLKRSAKLKFMPNTFIFPGGALSKADSDMQWKEHFTKKEISQLKPKKSTVDRPPMYLPREGELDRDLTLRLTAIRECFEESGILFLEKNGELISAEHVPDRTELTNWRKTVEGDAATFYDLCTELDAWPKIDGLFDWSNWLTPPSILPYRFDTAFYVASIPSIPSYAVQDGGETVDMAVMNPFDALARQDRGEILLHPPQFVELSRMAKFFGQEALMSYAQSRQDYGLIRWCPNQIFFRGCRISVMEGDDLHVDLIDGPVDHRFEKADEDDQSAEMSHLSRTIWKFEEGPTGKKQYTTMFTKTNLFYFDHKTLMTTPVDHETLQFIINPKGPV